jgi:hypothetical protein
MTPIRVTDRLFLTWDDFNWVVLRKRKKIKAGARDTYHPRYYATLSGACRALLNEVPKQHPICEDIEALAKSVKDAEARVAEVVAELRSEDGPSKKLADCYT